MSAARALDKSGYDTDKPELYLDNYSRLLEFGRDDEITLLELGIHKGGSLLMWRDFLPKAKIVGLDLEPPQIPDDTGRIIAYKGMQEDTVLLDRIGRESAPEGFDVIIDDASHFGDLTRISFWHLFENHLKPGGVYIVEDWGAGYWDKWHDGKFLKTRHPGLLERWAKALFQGRKETGLFCRLRLFFARLLMSLVIGWNVMIQPKKDHRAGIVGFIKELVDECGISDATMAGAGTGTPRHSKFAKMEIYLGQVIVYKPK